MNAIGRNSIYNLIGTILPLALFILTIPAYISLIGAARYGVLAIAWLVVGVFGMLDLGLGRAATQKIASLRESSSEDRRAALSTALVANIAIGSVGAALMLAGASYMFGSAMTLEDWLRAEAVQLVPLMAIGVPIVTTLGILNGALLGRERFLESNKVHVINSSLFQLLPLAVAWLHGPHLFPLVAVSLLARLVGVWQLWSHCRREFGTGLFGLFRRNDFLPMLRYGGWVTVSGLVGTALVFSDRAFIGSVLGAVAITVYTVPLDATRRLAVFADSLTNAIFPRLTLTNKAQTDELMAHAAAVLYFIITPIVAGLIIIADPLFRLWLGDELGAISAPFAQIFALAAWVNSFAKTAYVKLQAQGKPHLVAIVMIVQLPVYLVVLWWSLKSFGLESAAWIYLARIVIDTILLKMFARDGGKKILLIVTTFVALFGLIFFIQSVNEYRKYVLAAASVSGSFLFGVLGWLNMSTAMRTEFVIWAKRKREELR